MYFKKISFAYALFLSFLPTLCSDFAEDDDVELVMQYSTSGFGGTFEEYLASVQKNDRPTTLPWPQHNDDSDDSRSDDDMIGGVIGGRTKKTKRQIIPVLKTDSPSTTRQPIVLTHLAPRPLNPPSLPVSVMDLLAHFLKSDTPVLTSSKPVIYADGTGYSEKPAAKTVLARVEEENTDEQDLEAITTILMSPNLLVDFAMMERFFRSSQSDNTHILQKLLEQFEPPVKEFSPGMTGLDIYLKNNSEEGINTLSLGLVELFLKMKQDPHHVYTNGKGEQTCFAQDVEKSSLTNKKEILDLIAQHSPTISTTTTAHIVPLPHKTTSDSLLPGVTIYRYTPPTPSSEKNSVLAALPTHVKKTRRVQASLQICEEHESSLPHFYVPLTPRSADREQVLAECKFHMSRSREKLTFEELGAVIRCVDDSKNEDLTLLKQVLKNYARIKEVDESGRTILWSLIPYDKTPLSLKKLTLLLEAGASAGSFMDYLQSPFRSIDCENAPKASECCRKFCTYGI